VPKAQALINAAGALSTAGVRHAAELDPTSMKHRAAYCSVRGLGPVTWTYFTMLLGQPGVKADTWIVRFTTSALGHPVTSFQAEQLINSAANELDVSPTDLDHAIWRHLSAERDVKKMANRGELVFEDHLFENHSPTVLSTEYLAEDYPPRNLAGQGSRRPYGPANDQNMEDAGPRDGFDFSRRGLQWTLRRRLRGSSRLGTSSSKSATPLSRSGGDVPSTEAMIAHPAYPLIQCPPIWVAYVKEKVVIGLTDRHLGSLSSTGPVIPTDVPDSIDDLTVTLLLDPASIRLADGTPRTYPLLVTPQQRFPTVEIAMTAITGGNLDWQRRIGLHFMRDGRSVGFAWRRVCVVDSEADRVFARPPEPPQDLLDLAALTDEQPPDLVLALYRGDDRAARAFVWDALTNSDIVDVPDTQRTTALHDDAGADFAAKVRRIVKKKLAPMPMFAELAGFGEEIGRVIPTGIARVLRTLATEGAGGAAASVLLLTEEAFVPWELAVLPGEPLGPTFGGSSPFLGAHLAMSRWPLLPGRPRPTPQRTHTITRQAVLSARYDELAYWPKLPEAEAEAKRLSTEYSPMHTIDPLWDDVTRCLKGDPPVDWLHVALHGQFDPQGTDDGLVLLQGVAPDLSQQFLTPSQVTSFRMPNRLFVFLNACQVGAGNQELGNYAGMAVALLKAGACAVVAAPWNVDDVVASEVSKRFYAEVFANPPVTVAEALRRIRAEYTEDKVHMDPAHAQSTMLAYQLFGHPRLLLERRP